jgi:hypothetical protein
LTRTLTFPKEKSKLRLAIRGPSCATRAWGRFTIVTGTGVFSNAKGQGVIWGPHFGFATSACSCSESRSRHHASRIGSSRTLLERRVRDPEVGQCSGMSLEASDTLGSWTRLLRATSLPFWCISWKRPTALARSRKSGGFFERAEGEKLKARLAAEGRPAHINLVPIHRRWNDYEFDR